MVLGSDGNPIISYQDETNYDLKVADCVDPACTSAVVTIVDSDGAAGFYTSIVLGSDGYPIISYLNGAPKLRFEGGGLHRFGLFQRFGHHR